jgi:hypothetical protein
MLIKAFRQAGLPILISLPAKIYARMRREDQ